jgi:hypothetical protein
MSRLARIALALAALGVACAAHRHGAVKATVVRQAAQCGGEAEGPSARWIASEGALRAALGSGGLFGAEELTPPVDFAKEGVLAVYMGQRRTGGYRLVLHEPEVVVADRVATVVVRFEEPSPGMMVTQVLTSPCLLVRMTREGLREVRVVDPAGRLRATVSLPPR